MQTLTGTQSEAYLGDLVEKLPTHTLLKTNELVDGVSEQIREEIENSKVQLPKRLGKKKLQYPPPRSEDVLQEVENQMKIAQKKRIQLGGEEADLRKKVLAKSPKRGGPKSHLTEEDKLRLRNLVGRSRELQGSLKKQDQEIESLLHEGSLQRIRSHEKETEQRRQQRRVEVLQSLKSQQLKSLERAEKWEQSERVSQQIRARKYLHQEAEERQSKRQEQDTFQYRQEIKAIKQKSKFDIEEVEKHQRHHDEARGQHQARLASRLSQQPLTLSHPQNHFRSMVLQSIQQQRIQHQSEMKKGHQMRQKVYQYWEEVDLRHKPRSSELSKFCLPKQRSYSTHALSSDQQRLKGLENLEKAKKLKDIGKEIERKKNLAAPMLQPQPAYIDYAKEVKVKPYQTAECEFKSLLAREKSMEDYEQAKRALLLAEQIEAKSRKTKDKALITSVQHRMKILEALEND